jgi:hypothetical protein
VRPRSFGTIFAARAFRCGAYFSLRLLFFPARRAQRKIAHEINESMACTFTPDLSKSKVR